MFKSIFNILISQLIFIISGYSVNIYLGRSFGPVTFGIYGLVISLMTLTNLIQTNGLPQSVSKYIAEDEKNENAILKSGLRLQIISTLVITITYFLLARPISLLLNDVSLVPYIQLSSLIFPLYGIFSLYTGYYNGIHNFKKQALLNIIYSVAKAIFVIGLAYIFSLKGAIAGFIVAPFFALLFGFKLPKKTVKSFPYKKLISFSIPLIGFALLSTLLQSIDLYFIKALSEAKEAAGFYTANQNIARIPFFALSAFSVVMFPSISKNVKLKLHESSRELIHQALRVMFLLLIPATLLISATSRQIIDIIFSKAYLPGAASLSILIFGMSFLTIFTLLANILNGSGSPKRSLLISLMGVLVTAVSCSMLIPSYGLVGAALSTTIGAFLSMLLAAIFVYKKFNALVSVPRTIKIIFASLIIYVLAKIIILPVIFLPIVYTVLFSIYLGILILLKEVTFKDWEMVKGIIK